MRQCLAGSVASTSAAAAGGRVPSVRSCGMAPQGVLARFRDNGAAAHVACAYSTGAVDPSSASKVERILSFVEEHSPVPLSVQVPASLTSFMEDEEEGTFSQATWHHSYDEEAMEGSCELDEEEDADSTAADQHLIAEAAAIRRAMPAAATTSSSSRPSVSMYQATLCRARLANAAPHLVSPTSSWAYGSTTEPKPWFYSYDEEAEGAFEELAAPSPMQAYLAAQAERQALHEARHAARASRALRRATLRASLGDLEQMPPWVDPSAAAATAQQQHRLPLTGYAQLLPLAAEAVLMKLAAAEGGPEARRPQSWQFTWDEEAHGGLNDSVLSSC